MEVPILRADATDDDLQVEREGTDSIAAEPEAEADATVEVQATKLVCAVCGMDAGTCSHPPNHVMEVPA